MTGSQLVALGAVLLGAVLLGSVPALLGFIAGLTLGYITWGTA